MRESIEGQGNLEHLEHPDKKWVVRYLFLIATEFVERPGLPRVAARKHSRGFVSSLAGEPLPQGHYRLYASDGEVLKVQNNGAAWVILGS
jgi:hypothetical protein